MTARWRRTRASLRQLSFLAHKRIKAPENISTGQASHLIAMLSQAPAVNLGKK